MTLQSIGKYFERYTEPRAYPWVSEMLRDIQDEVDSRYMELPMDAYGVPIHLADLLASDEYGGRQFLCRGINVDARDGGKWWTVCIDYDSYSGTSEWCAAHRCHHVKPRTLESVLQEYGSEIADSASKPWSEIVDKYAAEIRDLLGGEGE